MSTEKPKNDFHFTSADVKKMVDDHNSKHDNPFLDDFDRDQVNPLTTMEDYFFAGKGSRVHQASKTDSEWSSGSFGIKPESLTSNTRTVRATPEDDLSYVFEGISPTEISAQILKSMIAANNPNYFLAGSDPVTMLRGLHSTVTELMKKDKEK